MRETIDVLAREEDGRIIVEVRDNYLTHTYRRLSFSCRDLDFAAVDAYMLSLCNHISFVREAGTLLGVDEIQLKEHDDSKWEPEEFPFYAMKFHGSKSPVDSESTSREFAHAWLHHLHRNPHHWQHWIFPDGYAPSGSDVEPGGIVEMPGAYAQEMIADWMGASMAYTGSFDMAEWLYRNMPRIKVHSKTAAYLRGQLDMLGYADVVYVQRFGSEAP